MIALIAAGRPGGDANEVRSTVPWCEAIARKHPPEMPGAALREIFMFADFLRETRRDVEDFMEDRLDLYARVLETAIEEKEDLLKTAMFVRMFDCCVDLGRQLGVFDPQNLHARRSDADRG